MNIGDVARANKSVIPNRLPMLDDIIYWAEYYLAQRQDHFFRGGWLSDTLFVVTLRDIPTGVLIILMQFIFLALSQIFLWFRKQ